MKIAFLSFYSGKIDRGVEVAVEALAQKLGQNHEVTVYQAGKRTITGVATVEIPLINGWPEDTSNSWWRFVYLDYYSRKIAKFTLSFVPYFFKNKFDVIIPTNGGWQVVICRLLTWLTGKKLLVQGNAGIGRDDLWQMLMFPDHYIAISPAGYDWAKTKFTWVKKSYIPYGVEIDEFRPKKTFTSTKELPTVLCIAAFVPYKRVDYLIKAMALVKQAKLLVIGQGPLEQKLRSLGESLLGKRFTLKTGINHDDLPQYYQKAKVFSLPSDSTEALGIVYIEALAAGLTIVAPDDPSRRQLLKDSALYTDVENENAYAATLVQALETDLSSEAYALAKQYSWDSIAAEYEKLLKNL